MGLVTEHVLHLQKHTEGFHATSLAQLRMVKRPSVMASPEPMATILGTLASWKREQQATFSRFTVRETSEGVFEASSSAFI